MESVYGVWSRDMKDFRDNKSKLVFIVMLKNHFVRMKISRGRNPHAYKKIVHNFKVLDDVAKKTLLVTHIKQLRKKRVLISRKEIQDRDYLYVSKKDLGDDILTLSRFKRMDF